MRVIVRFAKNKYTNIITAVNINFSKDSRTRIVTLVSVNVTTIYARTFKWEKYNALNIYLYIMHNTVTRIRTYNWGAQPPDGYRSFSSRRRK